MCRGLWVGFFVLVIVGKSLSQTPANTKISIESEDRFLLDVVLEVERNYDIIFLFDTKTASSVKIFKNFENVRLDVFLNQVLPDHCSYFLTSANQVLIFDHDQPRQCHSRKDFRGKYYRFDDEWALKGRNVNAEVTVDGSIRDRKTGEVLVGAAVVFGDGMYGTSTEANGEFEIKLPSGYYTMKLEYLGYESVYTPVEIKTNSVLDIFLSETTVVLKTVLISSEPENINITSTEIGLDKLDINMISLMPSFMGEVDVIKSLLILPGVSTVGEGAGGFNVRGGSVDQNLILMDEITMFNASHLFGFYSVFNPDFVRNIKLYKGSLHPKYGGRISSVLDVSLSGAMTNKLKIQGGIGMIASRLKVDIPIIKNKSGLAIGGRIAYPDWLLHSTKNLDLRNSSANFYDVTLKYTHAITDNNTLSVTGYNSLDQFSLSSDTIFAWNNASFSIGLDHSWTGIAGSFTFILSNYTNTVQDKNINGFRLDSYIDYKTIKADFDYNVSDQHKLTFGGILTFYDLNQGDFIPKELSSEDPLKMQDEKAVESALYLGDDFSINKWVSLTYGLRFSYWNNKGPGDVYIYNSELPKSEETVTDTLSFGKNESIAKYSGLEPRVAINYRLGIANSLKLGYTRSRQYLHLLSNTTAVTPTDQWQVSNHHIKPQVGDQISIGYFHNLKNNTYKLSAEGYYKTVSNRLDYKPGAEVLLNELIETDILPGKGLSYGIELMARKDKGRLTGWLGYTYSRSLIRIDSKYEDETINEGDYYPTNFDKPNDISTFVSYKIENHISLGATFTYSTGRPVTIPTSKYQVENFLSVIQYSGRNQYRIPDYHRLDLSLTIENLSNRDKYQGSWVITIFNVYARKNAYSVFFNQYGFAKKLSVLGTIFPSVTYNFKFL